MAAMPERQSEPRVLVPEMTDAEEWERFERESQRRMHMSGQEFVRRYYAGEFDAIFDTPEHHLALVALEGLIPVSAREQHGE